eukprot:CAMPEP_0175004794 /NCGR_PEP_ID=MMETSP0005-20121125/4958_1 /TAXON_ID=420556 /ORGANISM="Ochromonas sp., Strain CCMP1393" /LENGTH=272 /DNA_ID=CAMNT_0016259973 /DNA_START=129 /DNA_END=947 /DNA_ORIENTATION=-
MANFIGSTSNETNGSSSTAEGSALGSSATAGQDVSVVENAQIVLNRISSAAVRADRPPESVRLVCVSKTKPIEMIQQLYEAGFRHFGENYFQELLEKSAALPKDISWHFIGHLQSSKAAKLVKEVENLAVLETVDSTKLANKLNNACMSAERAEPLHVFLQVDTSGEATKSGVAEGPELEELVDFVLQGCPSLRIRGLMTIGAPGDSSCFDKLVSARSSVSTRILEHYETQEDLELSMGMSGDFEPAIERGATSVRVGSTIFGARLYPNKVA